MQKWKLKILQTAKKEIKTGKKLSYIHIPKTGGTFVRSILSKFPEINYIQHKQASENKNEIYFATIREPSERFESLLNFVFWHKENKVLKKNYIPKRLWYTYDDISVDLNKLISMMSDKELTNLKSFQSLHYYSKNITFMIPIKEFVPVLKFLGFNLEEKKYEPCNVSEKKRGSFSEETKLRIQKLYKEDVEMWNFWTRLD